MHDPNTPSCDSSEASSFLRRPEELRRFLDDIIRVASRAKSLLESGRGPLEACNSRAQPPPSRSPRWLYSFCFFCGEKGHIRANCDSCKEYLAAGKCLLVKGRIVLPTGQEIPRKVPGRTLKDRLDSWDLGNRSADIQNPPSSPGWLISLEDVGSQMPQTQRVSLGVSQPRLLVHPNTPSERPLCAPLSTEGPSCRSVPVQPQVPTQTPTVSSSSGDGLLCHPHSPSRILPTGYSRGRSHSRSRGRGRPRSPSCSYFESPPSRSYSHQYSYHLDRSHSRDSRGSRDYHPRRSPPPAPRLTHSLLEISRDEPTPVRPTSRLVNRMVSSDSYDTRQSRSSHMSTHSRRSCSCSRTPQPWYMLY